MVLHFFYSLDWFKKNWLCIPIYNQCPLHEPVSFKETQPKKLLKMTPNL